MSEILPVGGKLRFTRTQAAFRLTALQLHLHWGLWMPSLHVHIHAAANLGETLNCDSSPLSRPGLQNLLR